MPATTTPFKLGLLALAAIIGLLATALALGIRHTRKDTIRYETYFDESAQGLEVGSTVKYRGVRIGNVQDIAIAPDRRRVKVTMDIETTAVRRLDFEHRSPALRAQLATQGITGVKFVDMDFFENSPPPILPFPPGPNYIPSRPSLFAGLQSQLDELLNGLPPLVDNASAALAKVGRVLDRVEERQLVNRVGDVLDNFNGAADDIHNLTSELRRERIPGRIRNTLGKIDDVATKIGNTADELKGTHELIASAKRAVDSFGEVGRGSRGVSAQLERTLRELGDAARSVRDFMDELDREPDMLLKGKARSR